jgi:hypothetical protein
VAGLAILSIAAGLLAPPVLLATRAEQPWLLVAGWALTGAAAWAVYRATLARVGQLAAARREPLLDAVCGDDA